MENKLVFVNPICHNDDGTFEYDLLFSDTPDAVWGVDWDYNNPSICGDLTPDDDVISKKVRLRSTMPLKTIQETSCFSMEYAVYGIIALSWIDINKMEEYPESGRMVFKFGDDFDKIVNIIKEFGFEIE